MTSAFREQKIGRFFDLLDTDRDGAIEKQDFEAVTDRAAKQRGIAITDPRYTGLYIAHIKQWEAIAAADGDADGRVTRAEYIAYFDTIIGNEAALETVIDQAARINVEGLDSDGDGYISLAEYQIAQMAWLIPLEDSAQVFARLDLDGDGKLATDEVAAAFREFFLGEDHTTAASQLLGPIGISEG